MKSWKFLIGSILMLCIFLSCGSKSNLNHVHLLYDKKYHILTIRNIESVRIIKKIEFDLQQDTLIINKVAKKSLLFSKKLTLREMSMFTIKPRPIVEFIKLGDKLFHLSEISEFSIEEFFEKYFGTIIIVYPEKFPYLVK